MVETGIKNGPEEILPALCFQGFQPLPTVQGVGYSFTFDSMPVSLPGKLFLIAIVEGIGFVGCDGMVVGRCLVDVTGVCRWCVGSSGVHGLCPDPFCRSWLDLVSIGPGWDLGMKKHQRFGWCWWFCWDGRVPRGGRTLLSCSAHHNTF